MARLPDAAGQARNVENIGAMKHIKDLEDINGIRDIKGMPVRVLRGLFSAIGQLLVAADRFRADEAQREGVSHDEQHGPPTGLDGQSAEHQMTTVDYVRSATPGAKAATSARGRHRKPARTTTGRAGAIKNQRATSARKFRSLDATGNVRLLTPDMPAESTSRPIAPSNASSAGKAPGRRSRRTGKAAATTPAKPRKAAVDLPVPGYDGLSLASLRSRLRYLDATQLRILLEHERSASNRPDVVTMFERRIAKIESRPDAS